MQFRSRRNSATACIFAFLLLVVTGCSSTGSSDSNAMTPEQQEISNLREAVDVLKQAISNLSSERHEFQQRYLSAADELRTRSTMTEFLEARHRAQLQTMQGAEEKMRIAQNSQSNLQSINAQQLEKRRELESSVRKLQQQLTDNTELHGQLTVQVRELQLSLEQTQAERESLREQLAGTSQSSQNTAAALQARAKEIEQLRTQLTQVQTHLAASKKAEQAAMKELAATQSSSNTAAQTGDSEPVEAATAIAFLKDWGKRSVGEVREGQWNNDNKLFVGLVGGVSLLLLMLFFSGWRSRRARRKLKALKLQLQAPGSAAAPSPLRMDEVSPAVAQVHQAAEDLAKTMQLSPLANSHSLNQPSAPRQTQVVSHPHQAASNVQQPAQRPQALTNPVISRHLDGVFGGDDTDDCRNHHDPFSAWQRIGSVDSKQAARQGTKAERRRSAERLAASDPRQIQRTQRLEYCSRAHQPLLVTRRTLDSETRV